jgi:hypothetical protein
MKENKQEFIMLVKRYESVTLEEIQPIWDSQEDIGYCAIRVAEHLTGFGSKSTCTLCKPINGVCSKCIYGGRGYRFGCINSQNNKTYSGIENAETAEELLDAFRKRAKHLRKKYSKYFEDEKEEEKRIHA